MQNSYSLFLFIVHLSAQVSPLPWFPAHRSIITRHLKNLESTVNVATNASYWHDKFEKKIKDTHPFISSRQHDHSNSNDRKKQIFQSHFSTDLWLNKHLQAIRSSSMTPRLTLVKTKNRAEELHYKEHSTPVNIGQVSEHPAAISVRECAFLLGSACTTIARGNLAKLSDYLDNVIAIGASLKRSEKVTY
ncbi:hypothetical protein Ddc_19546 [Ditylenchus destructor]|nr:hypothetical protein Ddc_19546 [Ditylenchus destructor]